MRTSGNPNHKQNLVASLLRNDALCIDQRAIAERNHQVQLMSRIFQEAFEVIGWFGLNRGVAAFFENEMRRLDKENDGITHVESGTMHRYPPGPKKSVPYLDAFLGASYWSRLWIQQEILLTQELIFMTENIVLSYSQLRKKKAYYEPAPSALAILLGSGERGRFQDLPLALAIQSFSSNHCTNPRDKIFGLLGIVDPAERVEVNYNLSVREVFYSALDVALRSRSSSILPEFTIEHAFLDLGRAMHLTDLKSRRGVGVELRSTSGGDFTQEVLEYCTTVRAEQNMQNDITPSDRTNV